MNKLFLTLFFLAAITIVAAVLVLFPLKELISALNMPQFVQAGLTAKAM